MLQILLVFSLFVGAVMLWVYLSDRNAFPRWAKMTCAGLAIYVLIALLLSTPLLVVEKIWSHLRYRVWGAQRACMIWIWRDKAYVPVLARAKEAYFMPVVPVYVVNVTGEDLAAAIKNVLAAGHQHELPITEGVYNDPLLKAMNAESWDEVEREAIIGFTIRWTKEQAVLDVLETEVRRERVIDRMKRKLGISANVKQGNTRSVPDKRREFSATVSIDEIVDSILTIFQKSSGGSR